MGGGKDGGREGWGERRKRGGGVAFFKLAHFQKNSNSFQRFSKCCTGEILYHSNVHLPVKRVIDLSSNYVTVMWNQGTNHLFVWSKWPLNLASM